MATFPLLTLSPGSILYRCILICPIWRGDNVSVLDLLTSVGKSSYWLFMICLSIDYILFKTCSIIQMCHTSACLCYRTAYQMRRCFRQRFNGPSVIHSEQSLSFPYLSLAQCNITVLAILGPVPFPVVWHLPEAHAVFSRYRGQQAPLLLKISASAFV